MRTSQTLELTIEQKFAAIQSLVDTSLRMRKPGDWYVSCTGITSDDGNFCKSICGDGSTPFHAIEVCWSELVNIPEGSAIRIRKNDKIRHVRWNGFMWEDVKEPGE